MKRYYTLDDTEELESLYIPRIFFEENSEYFNMSTITKLLYAILLDKSNGSYFNYRQTELCEKLGIKNTSTLRKYLRELEEHNLLVRKRVGLNQPDDLLIKTIV